METWTYNDYGLALAISIGIACVVCWGLARAWALWREWRAREAAVRLSERVRAASPPAFTVAKKF
jgi:hypothetical protein